MGLESIVNVQITRQTQGVSQAGFGIPLILGPNGVFTGVRSYSSLSAVGDDFSTSTSEYKKAAKIFSQSPKPKQIKIKKSSTPVAQVVTVTPDVSGLSAATVFTQTINGVPFAFTSDTSPTASEVVAGLIALINAGSEPVTASGTTTLILTSDTAGLSFSHEEGARLSAVETTPNVGIASDILAAMQEDTDWYALLLVANDDLSIMEAAKTIEAVRRICLAMSSDSDIKTSATDDIGSLLKLKNFFRTALWYSGTLTDHLDGGVAGRLLPTQPGSETWAFKTIAGVATDTLTDSEIGFLKGKNVNYYIRLANKSITLDGKMAGGEWIDIIRFIDWLQARMEEEIFGDLTRLDKIPFTDGGIAILENDMRAVLDNGKRVGGIAPDQVDENDVLVPGYTLTIPKAASISVNDKAERRVTGLGFNAKLAGAIHAADIDGVVTL